MKILDYFKKFHIFHKWGKWSEVYRENWVAYLPDGKESQIIKYTQNRTCSVCGKYERRYI